MDFAGVHRLEWARLWLMALQSSLIFRLFFEWRERRKARVGFPSTSRFSKVFTFLAPRSIMVHRSFSVGWQLEDWMTKFVSTSHRTS